MDDQPKPDPAEVTAGWRDAPDQPTRYSKPTGGSFAPDADLRVALDKAVGHGRWETTSDFRTPAKEAALRMQGAGTVAPGHLSDHSRGTFGASGAHDIVLRGVGREEGERLLSSIPGVKSAKWEGPHGTQGAHFHVTMQDTTGWRDAGTEGWKDAPDQDVTGGKKVTVADIAKRLGPKPKGPPGVLDRFAARSDKARHDKQVAALQSIHDSVSAGVKKFNDPGGDPFAGLQNKAEGTAEAALGAAGGAFGYLAAPFTAPVDASVGRAVARATANAPEHITPPAAQPQVPRDQFGMPVAFHDPAGAGQVKATPTLADKVHGFLGEGAGDYSLRLPEDFVSNAALNVGLGATGFGEAQGAAEVGTRGAMDRLAKDHRPGGEVDPALPPERPDAPEPAKPAEPQAKPSSSAEAKAKRADARRRKRNPNVATPDDVRRMQDGEPSPFTHPGSFGIDEEAAFPVTPQPVYHGSPHEFDRFDLGKIGTGEGAQVFGHGLYFAGNREVAQYYRDELSRRNNVFTRGDETVSTEKLVDHLTAAMDRAWEGYGRTYDGLEDAKEIARALVDQDNFSEHENWVRYDSGWDEPRQEAYLSAMREARTWKAEASKGKLYTVDIPEDHEFLDWDKPLSEQSDHVKAALKKAGYSPPLRDVPTSSGKTLDSLLGEVPHEERIALVFARSAIRAAKGRVAEGLAAFRNSSGRATSAAAREASESLARKIEALGIDRFDITKAAADPRGSDIYAALAKEHGELDPETDTTAHSPEKASAHLREHGIAGNRYLDQGSRAAGDGSHNYVLFDGSRAEIKATEQKATEAKVGSGLHTPEEDRAAEAAIRGLDAPGIAAYVAKRNEGRPMGQIATAVGKAVERLQALGMTFDVKVLNPVDPGASDLIEAYGIQGVGLAGGKIGSTIRYRGAGWVGGRSGLHDSTLLHELTHAVTNMALHAGRAAVNAGTDLAQTVASLDRLTAHIIKTFNEQHARGEAPIHIQHVADSDEMLAYGFTHEPFQRWLETIPYASGNAWSDFVDTVRKLLGLPAKQHTALSALIRHGEALFNETSFDEVHAGFKEAVKTGGRDTGGTFPRINPPKPGDGAALMTHPEDSAWTDGGKAPMPKAGGGGSGGGSKGGYGGSGYGPGDIPPPGGPEHRGPIVGNEADPIERLDNALYRAGGSATADKLEAQEFLKNLPPELADPALQERLSREIEQQLIDPNHQIPDDLKPAYEAYTKYRDEVRETVNRLRARRDPTLEEFLPETGYTPRRVKGHEPTWDQAIDGPADKETDVTNKRGLIPSKRNLSPNTGSINERTAGWMVPDWRTGEMVFTREKPPEEVPSRIATMDEVEANTDIRYYRNPLINTVDEALRLRRVERNVQLLDHVKKTLKDEGMAFHYEWRDPTGVTRGPGEYKLPPGFVKVDSVPQLKGWAFHPEVAEVFRDYYPGAGTDLDNALGKLNRMMIGTLFITPIPHILNVAAHAVTGRGWDWLDIPGMAKGDLAAIPKAYLHGFTTSLEAMHEVWTKGPKYREMMREGAGMMYGDTQVRNFLSLMLEKAGHEIAQDPQNFKEFSRQFDLKSMGIHTAKDLTRLLYDKSNKSMWLVNDMFLMQRILELQKKGVDMRTAIHEAEKDIPNYRVPSRVMGSRGVSEFIRSRNFIVFGRYKYGQWKALSGMFKDFLGKDASAEERLDALGKILVTGLTMQAIFPAMDAALQKVSGNSDSRVRRPGPFAILDAVGQFMVGEKDYPTAISSMFSAAPLVSEGVDVYENKNFFGQPLIQAATPLGVGVQVFEAAADPIYPLKSALEFGKDGGGTRTVARMFGLDIPPEGTKAKQAKYRALDHRKALRREAKDPLENTIKGGVDKVFGGGESKQETPPPIPGDPNEKGDFTLGVIP